MSEHNPTPASAAAAASVEEQTRTQFRELVLATKELPCGNDGSSYEECLKGIDARLIAADVKLLGQLKGMCIFKIGDLAASIATCASLVEALKFMDDDNNKLAQYRRKQRESIRPPFTGGYRCSEEAACMQEKLHDEQQAAWKEDWYCSMALALEELSYPTQTMVKNNEGLNEYASITAACKQVLRDRLRSSIIT